MLPISEEPVKVPTYGLGKSVQEFLVNKDTHRP